MTQEEFKEAKLQIYQQYGITEEQLDAAAAALYKLFENLKELVDAIMAGLQELAETFRKTLQQCDHLSALGETIEAIQEAVYKAALHSPPSYSLANTMQYNAMQKQKLKSYKNRIGSAAIRRPKRIARSCC